MKKSNLLFFLLSLVPFLWSVPVRSQEATDTVTEVSPSLEFTYWCTSDDSVTISARLSFMRDRSVIALKNAVITFSASAGDKKTPVGEAIADSTGYATLRVPLTSSLPSDKERMITYTAEFAGKDKYQPASEVFTARPGKLEVSFEEVDSVRSILVKATQKDAKGNVIPIAEQRVKLYVNSLFRLFPIGEITLDKEGTGTAEFPKTLVGDSSGNIRVIAQIEENDIFGNISGSNVINWATPKHLLAAERPSRELWTPVAPLWMIITLIIMLTGVWAHYVYAVIQLIRIRKSANKDNPKY